MLPDDDAFKRQAPLFFQIEGQKLYLPFESIETKYEKRVPKHRRIYRDGARLESIGMVEEVYLVRGSIHNENEDPAILEQGIPPYPDLANRFVELARVQETGDFMHPRQGLVRAVLERFSLVESADERGVSRYEAQFVQDNEDNIDAAEMKPTGPRGAFVKLKETIEALERAGWASKMDEVLARIADVSENNPTDEFLSQYLGGAGGGDIYDMGGELSLSFETYEAPTSAWQPGSPSQEEIGDPGHPREHWMMRLVEQLREDVRKAREAARLQQRQRRTIIFAKPVSLFEVAAVTRNDVAVLIEANPQLDPFRVEPGATVYVENLTPPGFDARSAA